MLAGRGVAAFGAGAVAGAGGCIDFAGVDPKPLKDGDATGAAGAGFAASGSLLALLWPNPEKPVEPKDKGAADLAPAPKPEEPKAGFEASCWKENGLPVFVRGALCFSGEPLGVSSELLTGAAARGELLLGALELKPRNEPIPAGADAGAVLTGAAADVTAGALLGGVAVLLAASGIAEAGVVDGTDLFRFAKENAGAFLLCAALEGGVVPKPPKPPKPAGLIVDDAGAGAALLLKENGELDFCNSTSAALSCSLLDLARAVVPNAEDDGVVVLSGVF